MPACANFCPAVFRIILEKAPDMPISALTSRLAAYYQRHGLRATISRFAVAAKRMLFSSRMICFYCDLSAISSSPVDMPSSLKVQRHLNQDELSPLDLQEIISFWNPGIAEPNIKKRFAKGGSLWLIKADGLLAGYGWTLRGCTVEPHYFPLGPGDIHLFDFQVFPRYRGRGVNPVLVSHILSNVAAESQGRAFIEAAEWNQPQLSSLRRTPFHRLGAARKMTLFRRTIVYWDRGDVVEQGHRNELNNVSPAREGA